MLAASALLLNIKIAELDVGENAPAKQLISLTSDTSTTTRELSHNDASFKDLTKRKELTATVHVLTVEIEHIDIDALEQVQQSTKVDIHPSPGMIRLI